MDTSLLIGGAVGMAGAVVGKLFGGKVKAPSLPDVLYVAVVLVLFMLFGYIMANGLLLPGGIILGLVVGTAVIKLVWKKKH